MSKPYTTLFALSYLYAVAVALIGPDVTGWNTCGRSPFFLIAFAPFYAAGFVALVVAVGRLIRSAE